MVLMDDVRVTAADFNGREFDGCPFDSIPQWLIDAENNGDVTLYPADRDYALWKVRTSKGIEIAEPGDHIIRTEKGLELILEKDYKMRTFL
jgi:hypothetical protein